MSIRAMPLAAAVACAVCLSLLAEGDEDSPVDRANVQAGHWSFQPLRRPPLPELSDSNNAATQNAVDAFVLAKLRQRDLGLNPLAGKRELVRRAYFDLTGLPPAPEEVDAFIADSSPDAYERLIDRLLARPQYGERWGRYWLDVVRFGQTNGYERDDEKPFAWRYRDYVIRAFNEDKPFDRFVVEQLAGDELDDLAPDAIIATGFYRVGVWDDEPDDKLAAKYDELDDIVRTTGEAFLALTIGCARCHDHKFDPLPQEDYYSLATFFRNVAPYGKDKSDTHWELNPEAIYTPLATPEELVDWKRQQERLRGEIDELEKKKKTLADDAAAENKEVDGQLKSLRERMNQPPFDQALSVRETAVAQPNYHVLTRGNPRSPTKQVEPRFLTALGGAEPVVAVSVPAAGGMLRQALVDFGVAPPSGLRRRLAEWIASPDNPLTARVMANRIWHHHFGRGLAATPSDFGRTGLPPSHPELLDWLASELIDGGWRLKRLHKLIMMSHTYRQSSRVANPRAAASDPDNVLLWRQNLRRLEAEAIRDSMLSASGRLNLAMGGRGVFPELSAEVLSTQSRPGSGWDKSSDAEQGRRSAYIFVKRTLGVPFMETFDSPTPDKPCPARTTTTIAPQALVLLNSSFTDQQAAAMAERLIREAGSDRAAQIDRAFRLAVSRPPSADEAAIAQAFVARQIDERNKLAPAASPAPSPQDAGCQALTAFCKLVFNLNEFVYVD
jgi:hypothetical protein